MKTRPDEATAPPAGRRPRPGLLLGIIVAALVAVAVEVAWFSPPVREWILSRRSIPDLQRITTDQPGHVEARVTLIKKLLADDRPEIALPHAEELARMQPENAAAQRLAGEAAASAGHTELARRRLQRAAELGDRSPDMEVAYAQIEVMEENMGEAVRRLEPVVRSHPGHAAAWHLLGRASASLGIPETWVDSARTAVRLDPDNAAYRISLAEAHLFTDDTAAAVDAGRQAARLAPENPMAWLVLGRALARRVDDPGSGPEAEAAFKHSMELASRAGGADGMAERELGSYLLDQGRPAEAVPLLEIAVRSRTHDSQAAFLLATAYRRSGQVAKADRTIALWEKITEGERAIRYLEARVQADPYNAALRVDLARLLERAGRQDEAARHRESARSIRLRRAASEDSAAGRRSSP